MYTHCFPANGLNHQKMAVFVVACTNMYVYHVFILSPVMYSDLTGIFQMPYTRSGNVRVKIPDCEKVVSVFEDSKGAVDKRPVFRTLVSSSRL